GACFASLCASRTQSPSRSQLPPSPRSSLLPYTTLFRSLEVALAETLGAVPLDDLEEDGRAVFHRLGEDLEEISLLQIFTKPERPDRKSTRLNSSHVEISYAVFCLKKKNEVRYTQAAFSR